MIEDRQRKLQRIKTLSTLMDSKFTGPMGIRYGLDGLLGFLPIFGDTVTSLISYYIILEAALLGCPLPVLLRMLMNVLLENTIDFIPLVGNIFDFYWKSNNKNIALLLSWEQNPKHVTRGSFAVILIITLIFFVTTGLILYGGYEVLSALYRFIMNS